MEIKDIQSQILINRRVLSEMYYDLVFLKKQKSYFDNIGNVELEYEYHNAIKKHKKAIAKLVHLQKALKADKAFLTQVARELTVLMSAYE